MAAGNIPRIFGNLEATRDLGHETEEGHADGSHLPHLLSQQFPPSHSGRGAGYVGEMCKAPLPWSLALNSGCQISHSDRSSALLRVSAYTSGSGDEA